MKKIKSVYLQIFLPRVIFVEKNENLLNWAKLIILMFKKNV